jgi:hypothetical protein
MIGSLSDNFAAFATSGVNEAGSASIAVIAVAHFIKSLLEILFSSKWELMDLSSFNRGSFSKSFSLLDNWSNSFLLCKINPFTYE